MSDLRGHMCIDTVRVMPERGVPIILMRKFHESFLKARRYDDQIWEVFDEGLYL